MSNAQPLTSSAPPTVALAVSGHGFGHAVRCAEVARELLSRGARVLVRTDAPLWLFPQQVACAPRQDWPLDIGVVQHDGLEFDIDETRRRWTQFAHDFERQATLEAKLFNDHGVDLVIGDIPPLGFAAAARAGVPSYALGNFGWDWIYSAWPDFEDIVTCIRDGYAQADALLRLPLHAPDKDAFPAFGRIEDVPLVARKARRPRHQVRHELGLPEEADVVLISFGGFSARGLDLMTLEKWSKYLFVVTPPISVGASAPPNVRALNQTPADYVSLLAACDVVVTKPGYGIVADCLANHVPILFTDRGPFREYDVLAEALPRLARARHVPRDEVLAGQLGPHLDALLESRAGWTTQPMNGAQVVAERVLGAITVKQQSR